MADTTDAELTAERPDAARDLGFDPDALREKYRIERDKRLRVDGNAQYQEIKGEFAHYLDDPYVARVERAPLTDEVDVVVVGGGFGGLLAGARLREAGIKDIRLIEKGGDFRARPATWNPTSTCRSWKRSATCRSRSIRGRRKSWRTAAPSAATSTFTKTPASKRK